MLRLVVFASVLVCCLGAVPSIRHFRLDGRIIGGSDANIADHPYQLQLLVLQSWMCGASIISANWAITAAHCFKYGTENTTIRAGSSIFEQGGSVHSLSQVIIHKGYNTATGDNDIAVIQVYPDFPLGGSVQIIPLTTSTPATGVEVTVTGWGLTQENGSSSKQLQVVKIPVIDHAVCVSDYIFNTRNVTEHMFCAGLPEGGKNSCHGDSGGPVVANGQLVGIVSWGVGCGRPTYPGVFTDVADFRSWVTEHSGV